MHMMIMEKYYFPLKSQVSFKKTFRDFGLFRLYQRQHEPLRSRQVNCDKRTIACFILVQRFSPVYIENIEHFNIKVLIW